MRRLAATSVVLVLGATAAWSDDRCMYRNEFFSAGAVSCQAGRQFRCAAGAWQATGLGCADTTGDEEGLQVDPGGSAPAIREPSVAQPSPPAAPAD